MRHDDDDDVETHLDNMFEVFRDPFTILIVVAFLLMLLLGVSGVFYLFS